MKGEVRDPKHLRLDFYLDDNSTNSSNRTDNFIAFYRMYSCLL